MEQPISLVEVHMAVRKRGRIKQQVVTVLV